MIEAKKYSDTRKWRVIYIRPKFEKKISAKLVEKGIECFLPTKMEIREWHDRKKRLEVPVFPGYIFVRLNQKEVHQIYGINGFVRFLTTADEMDTVSDQEVEAMKALFQRDYQISADDPAGMPVMITTGPLTGLRGILEGSYGKDSVSVNIEILNKYIRTVVNGTDLERVHEESLLEAS